MESTNEFYEIVAEVLEVDSVTGAEALEDFSAWDSLGALSFIALARSRFGISISPEDLAGVVTVQDLVGLLKL